MERVDIRQISDNVIELIGERWMLISAGSADKMNVMTASWGGVGFLWNKPVVFVFVRPERYTFEFIEKSDYFTLSFLGEECREILNLCGSKSGRDMDKVVESGLVMHFTELGNPIYEQSEITIECRKIYADMLSKDAFLDKSVSSKWYPGQEGIHKMYVAEIVNCWVI